MRRVDLNVLEVTARLRAIGYQFAYDDGAHDPPGRSVRRQIARLEKKTGALPLALRAFYEVVGMVNWIGEHASLAPRDGSVAPDPLVVYPTSRSPIRAISQPTQPLRISKTRRTTMSSSSQQSTAVDPFPHCPIVRLRRRGNLTSVAIISTPVSTPLPLGKFGRYAGIL